MQFQETKTIIVNIIVTFVQAAFATWTATGYKTDKIAVAGAVGAGASAVWNLFIKPLLKKWGLLGETA